MDERKYLVLTRNKQNEFSNTTKSVVNVTLSGNTTFVTFQGNKTFGYNKKNVRFFECPQIINLKNSVVRLKNGLNKPWNEALLFHHQYVVLFANEYSKEFLVSEVEIVPDIAHREETKHLINYYKYIAKFLESTLPAPHYAYEHKLKKIRNDSVLSNYMKISQPRREECPPPLFPFGINLSQREAVTNALTSQLSIIQGPPGTGKTQTILNIIANLVCQNKTVAVVAGNNEATQNIYEKLEKEGFAFISASLGKTDLQKAFFDKQHHIPDITHWQLSEKILLQTRQTISSTAHRISERLELQNKQARGRELISRLEIESQYFDKYFSVEPVNPSKWSFGNKWSTPNLMQFMAEIESLSANDKLSLSIRFKWLFKYRIYKFGDIKNLSDNLFKGLISEYYQRRKAELAKSQRSIEQRLSQYNSRELLKQYTDSSMAILKHHIFSTHRNIEKIEFNERSYKYSFDHFIRRFPVVLSTTDSIINNKCDNTLFDYLIVDEASQINLLSGVLAMACAKNMVVVGDLQQLPHIPDKSLVANHSNIDAKFGISSEYSYLTESLLSSVNKVFIDNVPSTLLKEHYRCHPGIIDFCNQKYYGGQLVIMTHSDTEPFSIIKTTPGAHARKAPNGSSLINQRELDVIKKELLEVNLNNIAPEKIGIVTPYRAQAEKAILDINQEAIKIDTTHKFQGREKDIIIYSSTAGWTDKFNDCPNLINVAVSRAKEQFIIVIAGDLLKKQGTNMGDLIRHIEYQSMSPNIFESKIVSIFDCLYSEYSPVLQSFKNRIVNKSKYLSENLMATLLDDILADERFSSFTYKLDYPLNLLINDFEILTSIEQKFGRNLNSHIDFLIFNKLDKLPVLAIEVDGYCFHALNARQEQRDQIKDSITSKLGIRLLRLATNSSGEKEKILRELQNIIARIPESDTEQHESIF